MGSVADHSRPSMHERTQAMLASWTSDAQLVIRRGVVAAALLFATLALISTLAIPPLSPTDESANVGYALSLARGELPTIQTPISADGFPELHERLEFDVRIGRNYRTYIWTANHPPLFYAVVAIPLRLSDEFGAPLAGLWISRGINIAFGVTAVFATAWLAGMLVPGQPAVSILAAAWIAVIPAFAFISGLLFNDTLSTALAATSLALAAKHVREGGSRPTLVWLCVAAAAGGLTRLPGLLVAGLAMGAIIEGVYRRQGARSPRVRPAIRVGVVVAVAVAVTSAPFYLRNMTLYGEPTGTSAVLSAVGREAGPSTLSQLVDPAFWLANVHQLLGTSVRSDDLWETLLPIPPLLLLVVSGMLFALPAVGFAWALLRPGRTSLVVGRRLLAWFFVLPAVLLLMTAIHQSRGGLPHGRYLFAGLPVLAVAAAVGLHRVGRIAAALALCAGLVMTLAFNWPGFVHAHSTGAPPFHPLATLLDPPLRGGVALSAGILVVVLALATVVIHAIATCHRVGVDDGCRRNDVAELS